MSRPHTFGTVATLLFAMPGLAVAQPAPSQIPARAPEGAPPSAPDVAPPLNAPEVAPPVESPSSEPVEANPATRRASGGGATPSAIQAASSPAGPPPVPARTPGVSSPGAAVPLSGTPPAEGAPAGYHNGTFYIRSRDDVFRLYILGRVHVDWVGQFGPGVSQVAPGNGLTNGFYLRRARLELGGEFFQTWQWFVGAEFSSSTSIDNAAGQMTTPTCKPSTTGALPCTDKENPVENPTVKPIPTDVFVNYGPSPWANLEAGQFYLPFTLENRISDNTTPFLERSMAVRNIGAPLQRDIGAMFWGEAPDRTIYYALAIVDGDGPNRPNVDSRYDWAARLVVRPVAAATPSPIRFSQIGASAKLGSRDPTKVGYDLPSLTTQGGFAFWKPTYTDSLGRTIHIIPSATQWGLAGDVYVPVDRFDFTAEYVYNVYDTREAVDGYQISPYTERTGYLRGYGWYAQAAYWIMGDENIIGYPSYGRPLHVDLAAPQNPPRHGLQVLAKFERLALTYAGAARGGRLDPKTPDGFIDVDDFEVGVNYWATKHLRVGVNYTHYMFPGAAPVSASTTGGPAQVLGGQRATSPAQLLAAGVDDGARNGSGTLEEVQARMGVQF